MSDQVAIVVGAGGTIGGACAVRLAAGRDLVLCADLSAERAGRTVDTILRAGGRAEAVAADAAGADFAGQVTAAVPSGAAVTAVVHAVAYEEHVPSDKATRESLERSFAVGPLAAFTLFRELRAEGHLRPGSALTAVGSLHATYPFANCLGYNAAHGALAQVVRTLAHEWAADGIRVNAVVPGWIRTDAEVAFYGEAHLDRVAGGLPLGRFGTGEDIAQAVAAICAPSRRPTSQAVSSPWTGRSERRWPGLPAAARTREPAVNVVCVFAHQDDEMRCLGTLLRLAERGASVSFVCVTNGNKGLPFDGEASAERAARVRETEMRSVAGLFRRRVPLPRL